MRQRRVVALVIGILLLAPALGLLVGGAAIGVYELAARANDGWHSVDIDRVHSDGVAVTTGEAAIDVRAPAAVVSWLDLELRFRATGAGGEPVFVGVAPTSDVSRYLSGAVHEQIVSVGSNGATRYRHVDGSVQQVAAPADQDFWIAESTGAGPQEVRWAPESGHWQIAFLNASGQSGVTMQVQAGFRSSALLLTAAVVLVGAGILLAAVGTILVVRGTPVPEPRPPADSSLHPLVIEARIAPDLSRWLWLVKWLAAIPHFIVLAFLWAALAVTTVVAWFVILVAGQYPRPIFDFNVGVLRWTWRVQHYCGTGGLGTDRYPPFTLEELPDDDTHFTVAYPERLSRGLVLVKWLLLLPHWVIVALLAGTQSRTNEDGVSVGGWPGVLGLLTLVAGVVLLVSGAPNRGLFDVIVGLNRWVYRVAVYALLMTDVYPPFRYDGGGAELRPDVPPDLGRPPVEASPPLVRS